jgi:hypothetical protein
VQRAGEPLMGIAIWCDVKDKGHPFDEREAIIVNPDGDARYFCQAHCIPAFVTAFHTARIAGESGIFLPTLGGKFTVMPDDRQPAHESQPGHGTPRKDTPDDGDPRKTTPDNGTARNGTLGAGAARKGALAEGTPPPGANRKAAQAIADLLEQQTRPGVGKPASATYGGRA